MSSSHASLHTAVWLAIVVLALAASPASAAAADATTGYARYEALRLHLESIAQSPDASLRSLGRTREGREVYMLAIGRGNLDEKPAVLMVANVDGPRLVDGELALRVARAMVERAATDKRLGGLLDRFTFYVIPRPSPDATEACFQRPRRERTANTRPIDDDNDGRIDEDGPDDLDGDGQITKMRVEDSSGPYMPHPDDPRVLIKADPKRGEHGRYRMYSEGVDNDGAGLVNEDPPGGVCFNRNFPFGYDYFGREAGPHQVSEPESRAVADFAYAHPNIAAVVTLGPEDNLARPWKPDPKPSSQKIKTSVLPEDAPWLAHLGRHYRETFGPSEPAEERKGAGSFCQWAYFHFGRWSLAARGWWISQDMPREAATGASEQHTSKKDDRGADQRAALQWLAERKINGFVAWKTFAHPDFPHSKVEIGGFAPLVRDNPPVEEIPSLVQKQLEFVCSVAEHLPRLALGRIDAKPLGGGVYRVTVDVVNHGCLPTGPEMGRIAGEPCPLQIEFTLPQNVSLVSGSARSRLPRIAGTGGKVEKQLLLRAATDEPATVRVRVWSPSVGQATGQFTLEPTEENEGAGKKTR